VFQQRYGNGITIFHLLLTGQILEIPPVVNALLQALQYSEALFAHGASRNIKRAARFISSKQSPCHELPFAGTIAITFGVAEFEPMRKPYNRPTIGQHERVNFHVVVPRGTSLRPSFG
jgi:hypothetical protein